MKLRLKTLKAIIIIASILASTAMATGRVYFRNDSLYAVGLTFLDYPIKDAEGKDIPDRYETYTLQPVGASISQGNYNHLSPGATTLITITSSYNFSWDSGGGGCWSQGIQEVKPNPNKESFYVFKLKIHDKFQLVFRNNVTDSNIDAYCVKR